MEKLILPIQRSGFRVLCFLATGSDHPDNLPAHDRRGLNMTKENMTTENMTTGVRTGATNKRVEMLMEWYKGCMPLQTKRSDSPQIDVTGNNFGMDKVFKLYSDTSANLSMFYPADYFILLRPDLIFKMDLFGFWIKAKDSVAFPFRECYPGHDPDRFVAMPRYALDVLRHHYSGADGASFFTMTHHLFRDLINVKDPWLSEHIVFWLDEHHDADTAKDFNPMYDIVGRETIDNDVKCPTNKE